MKLILALKSKTEHAAIQTHFIKNTLTILQKRDNVFLIGIVLVAALIYAKLGWFDITTYDDATYYSYCISLAKLPALDVIRHLFVDVTNNNWHPVTVISFYLFDHLLFDLDAGASHLINVLIHLMNIILVYLIIGKLRFSATIALIVAFLFAMHPLQVEAVAWIAERKGMLAAMLMFLSLLNYLEYKETHFKKKYVYSLIYFMLGMMSKASIVTFPVLLIIISHYLYNTSLVPRKHGKINRVYLETLPFFVVSMIIGPVLVYIHYETGALGLMQYVGILERFHNFVNSIRVYLTQILIPDDFSIVYAYKTTIPLKLLIPSYLLFIGLISSAIYSFFHRKDVFLGLCWFFILLFPLSGLIQTGSHPHADRYMYIPVIGIFLFVGKVLTWLLYHAKKTKIILIALLCGTLTISTYINILKWKNTMTLFHNSVETIGDTYLAHASLSFFYLHFGKMSSGMNEYELAQKLSFNKPEFYLGIINTLYIKKHLDEAEKVTKDAIAALNNGINAYAFFKILVQIHIDKKEYAKALKTIDICLKIKSDDPDTYYLLGLLQQNTGEIENAITSYNLALKYNAKFTLASEAIRKLDNIPNSSPPNIKNNKIK